MASPNPGISVKPPFGGQRCDLDRDSVPSDCAFLLRNWSKRDGKFMVRPGFDSQVGSQVYQYIVGAAQYDHHSGGTRTVLATPVGWIKYDYTTSDWEDITDPGNLLTGSESSHQLFRVFYKSNKAYLIGVNGHEDAPKCWDGETDYYSDVGGSPPKARCLAVCNNRLALGNTFTTQANAHQVDVSEFNDFEDGWGAVQTTNLMDTPGEIVTIHELGSLSAAIYKTDAIYLMSAEDSAAPFSFTLVSPFIRGPASPRCVVTVPGGQVFLSWDGNLWSFDGTTPTPLSAAIRRHITQTADIGMLSRAFGFYDSTHNEVWFIYRGRGSQYMDSGVVISLDDMSVWPISFNGFYPTAGIGARLEQFTKIGDLWQTLGELTDPIKDWTHLYDLNLLACSDGKVVKEGGYTDLDTSIESVVETRMVKSSEASQEVSASSWAAALGGSSTKTFEAGNPRQYFMIQESEHNFNRTVDTQIVSVELGYANGGEDTQYTTPKNMNLTSKKLVLGHRKTARSFCLRLTASSNKAIQWRGSVVNGVGRGLK